MDTCLFRTKEIYADIKRIENLCLLSINILNYIWPNYTRAIYQLRAYTLNMLSCATYLATLYLCY